MLRFDHPAGPVWRIAPGGTTPVYLNRITARVAVVNSRGRTSKWAKRPMWVPIDDLFETKAEALTEYRQRRAAALNLTTEG